MEPAGIYNIGIPSIKSRYKKRKRNPFAFSTDSLTFAAPNSSLGIYCIGSQRYNCGGAITKKM